MFFWIPHIFLWMFQSPETITIGKISRSIEEHEESYLQSPYLLANLNSQVFALDLGDSTIWAWDAQGNFLNRFSGQGQGPGELTRPYNFYGKDKSLFVVHDNLSALEIFSSSGKFEKREKAPLGSHFVISFNNNKIYSNLETPGTIVWESSPKNKTNHREEVILAFEDPQDLPRSYLAGMLENIMFVCTRSSTQDRVYFCAINVETQVIVDLRSFKTIQKSLEEDFPEGIPKGTPFYAYTLASLGTSKELGFLLVEQAIKVDKQYCYVWRYHNQELSCFRFAYEKLGGYPRALLHLGGSSWVAGVSGAITFFEMDLL